MKALDIQIKSSKQVHDEFLADYKRAGGDASKMPTVKPQVYFTSLEAVRALITDKRMELLRLIRKHAPKSISQLAKLAGRDFKNVHTDVAALKEYGLVVMSRGGKAGKTSRQAVTAPYGAINIHAAI